MLSEQTISQGSQAQVSADSETGKILKDLGIDLELIAQNVDLSKVVTHRFVEVTRDSSMTGKRVFNTFMTVKVSNNGFLPVKNVEVVEVIPKVVAESASLIRSDFGFVVLQEDPVIKFMIDELPAGSETEIGYSVEKRVSEEDLNGWNAPVIAGFEEDSGSSEECLQKPCQIGVYDKLLGKCVYTNKPDGFSCASDKHCVQGDCVMSGSIPSERPGFDVVPVLLGVLGLALIAVLVFKLVEKPVK